MIRRMNPLKRLIAWFRPKHDTDWQEAERMRQERETIRTSQLTGPPNIPPTPDVLDPDDRR
jgi:hypothetical protein